MPGDLVRDNFLGDMRRLHRATVQLAKNKDCKTIEFIDEFWKVVTPFIEKIPGISSYKVWECAYENLPGEEAGQEKILLRDVTGKHGNNGFLQVPGSKAAFKQKLDGYFDAGILKQMIDIDMPPGFSHVDIPVFTGDGPLPCFLLTLVHREEDPGLAGEKHFIDYIETLSHHLGLSWDLFQDKIAEILLEKIDRRLSHRQKQAPPSTLEHLKRLFIALAREIHAEWCALFLVREKEQSLGLETANYDSELQLEISLEDKKNVLVKSFTGDHNSQLLGRESLEKNFDIKDLKTIEKAIRKEKRQARQKQGKKHSTPYIIFEHARLLPFFSGDRKLGLMFFARAKKSADHTPQDRFDYETRPFTPFENFLLSKVQRHTANLIAAHEGVQRRMRDIRSILEQVIRPVNESSSTTDKRGLDRENVDKLHERLKYAHASSRIAEQYIRNFELLLDIDTRNIKINKGTITDLRGYLIDVARRFTPLVRRKYIHINVTPDTRRGIPLDIEEDLFGIVILNLLDNAIKYSFDPEDRGRRGFQEKPQSTEDPENILITAEENGDFVNIWVSSCGIEIPETDKKHIFERDFRCHYASDRNTFGTGAGLYLVTRILEKHGGAIELVQGTPQYITKFKITMPGKSRRPHSYPGEFK